MFDYIPIFGGIKVIEDPNCMQTWQLDDFTRELMGYEWVAQFDLWAQNNLPKQPACYMLGQDTMIVHPSVAQALRDKVQERSQILWSTMYSQPILPRGIGIVAGCYG